MRPEKQEENPTLFTPPSPDGMARAVAVLRAGGVVAMPTETVYGLAADARDGQAVAKIYAIKGRPSFNPLIVHVESVAMAEQIGVFDDTARLLAAAFWPGPMTLVVPQKDRAVPSLVTAGLDTVALRVPAHPVARALLREFGGPLAAPSANKSGQLSPTTPLHVAASLGDDTPLVLTGGPCTVGLESTIIDASVHPVTILRAGAVTADDVASVLGYVPLCVIEAAVDGTVKSPGQLLRHYAPRTPMRLRAVDVARDEALLAFGSTRFMGVKGGGGVADLPATRVRNLSENGDLIEAAANLFRYLHDLDASGARAIAVMDIPNTGLGVAINDRLRRGAESRD